MQLMQLGGLSLLCFLYLCISSTNSSHACSNYHYKFEPVEDLLCNPYTDNETDIIKLECSVRGPILPDDISLTIRWVRNLDSKGAIESLDELAVERPDLVEIVTLSVLTQTPPNVFNDVRSVLTLRDVIPNDVAGSYYCHAEVRVSNVDGGETVLASEESTITTIRNEYTVEKICPTGIHRQSGNLACVSFNVAIPEPLRAPPPPDSVPSTTADLSPSTSSSASVSTIPASTLPPGGQTIGEGGNSMLGATSTSPSLTSKLNGAMLSGTVIIILSSVGGGLCIVIHVLLALVGCLWVKSSRKRRGREFRMPHDSRKVSTVSLISSAPTSVVSLPPHHALPTLPSPVGTQVTTPPGPPGPSAPSGGLPGPLGPPSDNSSLPPAINIPATSPSGQRYALAPPSHPPPVAPKSKLVNPQSHLTQHRSTLPTRLSHQVSLEPLPSCRDDHNDMYASVLQARHERRAATIAGDMGFYASASPTQQQLSPILDLQDNSYKSLNEYLMDDQQEYEAPCGVRENYINQDVSIDNEYEDDDDDSDSDLDQIYVQTIVRNTGSVSILSDATPTAISTTTTSTTDKDAGVLKRDIPLPPQCPIPMPPGKTCKLPGFNLMPPPRSPSPMPSGAVVPSGYRGNDEIPPPPSIHLIPSRNANSVPVATTTPVLLRADSSETPSPPSVHLIPPYSNTAGQVTPKSTGSEIPPPRILNLNTPSNSSSSNTSSMLRTKPGMHPILAQKLKSLVPVARVSMDGEYVVPNEALEAEGGLLSDGEGEEEEEEALADYIDIS